MKNPKLSLPILSLALVVADTVSAQANTVPGRDLALATTSTISRYRRTGTFPNGVQAIGALTTCCNPGIGDIPFQAAMNANHGFIHYIIARESNGRFEQISNYAWVKHTFGSNNNPGACGTCLTPNVTTSFVVQGCNDTYLASQAVDHFNLGPPSEVNPWTGVWNPICSYFDTGNPAVAPAQQCDGIRSVTQTQANALNTAINLAMRVYDDDLNVPGATFWYQSGYLVAGEHESLRGNNHGSRQFTPTFGSTQWTLTDGPSVLLGTVLQRWTGASIDSNTNGTDDGRYFVGVKVTGPTNGLYHYEYAVHNRDNARGAGTFRIPICQYAQVLNLGFHDVDRNAVTDWTAAKVGSEIVFQTTASNPNPLKWNSIYNFRFDSDAAPLAGNVLLDQYAVGPGALTVSVPSTTPSGVFNQNLGAGCGAGAVPSLFATGTPPRATIGNATLALTSRNNPANAPCGFLLSTVQGSTLVGPGCTAWTGDVSSLLGPLVAQADASGVASIPLAVPNDPSLEGVTLDFQALNITVGGAFLNSFNLSNGLRVRAGNLITTCP